jgi:tetraprenyl-beta-curcumene synthase
MLVRFQAAYDYADTVAEQPADDPIANSHQLHRPLIDALNLSCKQANYYEYSRLQDDGGYLAALTDSCRIAFQEMPSRALVQRSATHAASKIVTYQSLNHDTDSKTHDKLALWARRETPLGVDLRWWETSAACASSLTVLALLSAAASPTLSARHVSEIEGAYHPWIGALHTLLDSLVDWSEDERAGQPNLLDSYSTPSELETRMQMLARRSRQAVRSLPNAARHEVVLAAMVGVYVIAPGARSRRTQNVADRILEEVDDLASPVLLALRARRTLRTNKIGR